MTILINGVGKKEKRRGLRKNQTSAELKMWELLRNNQLGVKFRRQVSIGPYIADFYCREKCLVVELDGLQHAENAEYDLKRSEFFSSIGIRTVRFWNNEVNADIKKVKQAIVQVLQETVVDPSRDPLKVNYF